MASSYLVKKADTYYFRHYIPIRVQPILRRKELVKTLKVTKKSVAVQISRELKIVFDMVMDKAERQPSITWKEICDVMEKAFEGIYKKYAQNFDIHGIGYDDHHNPLNYIPPEYESYVMMEDVDIDWTEFSELTELVNKITEWAGVQVETESREYNLLCFKAIQMLYQHQDRKNNPDRYEDGILQKIHQNLERLNTKPVKNNTTEIEYRNSKSKIVDIWSEVKKIHISKCEEGSGTPEEYNGIVKNVIFPLLEILLNKGIGAVYVDEITTKTINSFLENLRYLPAQFSKRFLEKGITFSQALDYSIRIENGESVELDELLIKHLKLRNTKNTINHKYIPRLKSILQYSVNQGYIEKNLLQGRDYDYGKNDTKSYRPFFKSELEIIFSNKIFSQKTVPVKANNYKGLPAYFQYWIPIIGLYSGARQTEISQLRVIDIIEVEGIYCINIVRSKETRVKNKDSIRMVPIHPVLIDIGFIQFVNWRRSQGERFIFPELSKDKGSPVSSWFSLFLKNVCKITNTVPLTKVTFHSFRNNFIDEYKQKGTPVHFAGETVGHKTGGMSYGVYGSKIDIKIKFEQLKKNVKYSSVSFPWLLEQPKIFPWEKG